MGVSLLSILKIGFAWGGDAGARRGLSGAGLALALGVEAFSVCSLEEKTNNQQL